MDILNECPVCSDTYTNPHILHCGHSFCKVCIEGLIKNMTINCPCCRANTDSEAIVPNYALIYALETQKKGERDFFLKSQEIPDMKCGFCKQGAPEFLCKSCNEYICDKCKTIHGKIKGADDHELENLAECQRIAKEAVNEIIFVVEEEINKSITCASAIKNEIFLVKMKQGNALKKSSELYEKYTTEVKNKFLQLDEEIKSQCMQEVDNLQQLETKLQQKIRKLERKHTEIVRKENIWATEGTSMLEEVQALVDSHPVSRVEITPLELEVVEVGTRNIAEAVVIKKIGGDIKCHKNVADEAGKLTEDAATVTVGARRSNAETVLKTKTLGNVLHVINYEVIGGLFLSLEDRQWTLKKSIKLVSKSSVLRLIGDELWQGNASGITVLNLELEPIKEMNNIPHITQVNDVADDRHGLVLVATNSGLYKMTTGGRIDRSDSARGFSSVSVHEDDLYAAGYNERTIDHLSWRKELFTNFSIPNSCTKMCVNEAGVFVHQKITEHKCSATKHLMFYQYSLDGDLLSSSISGQVGKNLFPVFCSVDFTRKSSQGNIPYETIRANAWNLLAIPSSFEEPCCALYFNDRLYIARKDGSIQMYM